MYWTDTSRDVIERATMDGNSRMILHSSGLTNALGITLDYDNQVLYWVDRSLKRIESSAVNGSNRQVLRSSLRDPWDVTFYGGKLYWTDTYYDRIYSYSVTSTPASIIQVLYVGANSYGIRAVSEDRQPLSMSNLRHYFILSSYYLYIFSG